MADEADKTGLVAIVIALIAFFVTFGQFLLQASGTIGVGRRRCQPSVMGQWAKTRALRWDWTELRFETVFSTPDIYLKSIPSQSPRSRVGNFPFLSSANLILGDTGSRQRTHCNKVDTYNSKVDLGRSVSWLALLDQLHESQSSCFSADSVEFTISEGFKPPAATNVTACTLSCPAITFHSQSWDFMPPDLVRPVASSTVGDIIAIVHRLGMEWKELRPDEGIMRAEGNGQSIVSMSVGRLGILLQYASGGAIGEKKRLVRPARQRLWTNNIRGDRNRRRDEIDTVSLYLYYICCITLVDTFFEWTDRGVHGRSPSFIVSYS